MRNAESSQPEWMVFYEELRQQIISGRIKPDQQLSLESVKKEMEISLSLDHEKQAIDFLVAEGLIKQKNNQITTTHLPARSKRNVGFIDDYLAAGRYPSIKTEKLEIVSTEQARLEVKKYLPPESNELWIRHYHVQLIDGVPYAIADSYIPHQHFKTLFPKLRNASVDLFGLMKALGYPVTKKEESLYVDQPTLTERSLLQIIELMRVQIVRLDSRIWSNSTLVEVCLLCDRADLYEFNYTVQMNS